MKANETLSITLTGSSGKSNLNGLKEQELPVDRRGICGEEGLQHSWRLRGVIADQIPNSPQVHSVRFTLKFVPLTMYMPVRLKLHFGGFTSSQRKKIQL